MEANDTTDLLGLKLSGHLTVDSLEAALGPLERDVAAGPRRSLVIDCLSMTGYDGDARNAFVRRMKGLREHLHRIAILTDKPLWHMVIATMRLATGTQMRSFEDRSAGEAWAKETAPGS